MRRSGWSRGRRSTLLATAMHTRLLPRSQEASCCNRHSAERVVNHLSGHVRVGAKPGSRTGATGQGGQEQANPTQHRAAARRWDNHSPVFCPLRSAYCCPKAAPLAFPERTFRVLLIHLLHQPGPARAPCIVSLASLHSLSAQPLQVHGYVRRQVQRQQRRRLHVQSRLGLRHVSRQQCRVLVLIHTTRARL